MKYIVALTLLFSFISSAFGCVDTACCVKKTEIHTSANSKTISNCSSDESSSAGNFPESHCSLHCVHVMNLFAQVVVIDLATDLIPSLVPKYSFIYENPVLDSIERPPLA